MHGAMSRGVAAFNRSERNIFAAEVLNHGEWICLRADN
jgi:hypothetical protein